MPDRTVSFRFYEELNDFLPKEKRKKTFSYNFRYNQSVKDAIEALGIPHAEVDLILVNGNSVDFSYVLKMEIMFLFIRFLRALTFHWFPGFEMRHCVR